MAKVTLEFPDKFIDKLSKLGERTDEIIEKSLKAGAEVVENAVKSNLDRVIGKATKYESRSTGELRKSVGVSPVKVDRDGVYNIKIGFADTRSVSNARIASVIEHGKSGQPARPFIAPAKRQSASAAQAAMERAFEEEVEKL